MWQDATTKLSSAAISALMKDRAPLLRDRGPPPKRLRGRGPLPPDHVVRNPHTVLHHLLGAAVVAHLGGLQSSSTRAYKRPVQRLVPPCRHGNGIVFVALEFALRQSPRCLRATVTHMCVQVVQSGAAAESLLFWPALGEALDLKHRSRPSATLLVDLIAGGAERGRRREPACPAGTGGGAGATNAHSTGI